MDRVIALRNRYRPGWPELRCPANVGGGVAVCRCRGDGRGCGAGQRPLAVAGVVGEVDHHLQRLGRVRVGQRVGGTRADAVGFQRRPGRVEPLPLVGGVGGDVRHAVGVGDAAQVNAEHCRHAEHVRSGDGRSTGGGVGSCPPDFEEVARSGGNPGGDGDVGLVKRAADGPSCCRAAVQVVGVGGTYSKPLSIDSSGIACDHPVGRAAAQHGVGRVRVGVDNVICDGARIAQGGHHGARIAAGVPVNLDQRGRCTGLGAKMYPYAGQRVGARARGERCGSSRC